MVSEVPCADIMWFYSVSVLLNLETWSSLIFLDLFGVFVHIHCPFHWVAAILSCFIKKYQSKGSPLSQWQLYEGATCVWLWGEQSRKSISCYFFIGLCGIFLFSKILHTQKEKKKTSKQSTKHSEEDIFQNLQSLNSYRSMVGKPNSVLLRDGLLMIKTKDLKYKYFNSIPQQC